MGSGLLNLATVPRDLRARSKGTSRGRARLLLRAALEATMSEAGLDIAANVPHSDIETLKAVIARSQIVVARDYVRDLASDLASDLARNSAALLAKRRLPAGFEAVDVAVLDWIACEARRAGRGLAWM